MYQVNHERDQEHEHAQAVYRAAVEGDALIIDNLITQRVLISSVRMKGDYDWHPISQCAFEGNDKAVRFLLFHKGVVRYPGARKTDLLLGYARGGHVKQVNRALKITH